MKKIFLLVFTIAMTLGSYAYTINAKSIDYSNIEVEFTELDLLVNIQMFIESEQNENYREFEIKRPTKLLDAKDNESYYYVGFVGGGYIIIYTSVEKPAIIEFSYTGSLLNESHEMSNEKLYYFYPSLIASKDERKDLFKAENITFNMEIKSEDAIKRTEELESEISKIDFTQKVKKINESKNIIKQENTDVLIKEKSYSVDLTGQSEFLLLGGSNGIIWGGELPTTSYTYLDLIDIDFVDDWGTYDEFDDLPNVDNHCVATAAFNTLLYYRAFYNNPINENDRETVFLDIHSYIHNGPVTPTQYRSRFTSYIENETDYSIITNSTSNTWSVYKGQIAQNKMTYLTIWPTLLTAHTFCGIGYREYETGEYYVHAVDGWYNNNNHPTDRWYLFGTSLYKTGVVVLSPGGC